MYLFICKFLYFKDIKISQIDILLELCNTNPKFYILQPKIFVLVSAWCFGKAACLESNVYGLKEVV